MRVGYVCLSTSWYGASDYSLFMQSNSSSMIQSKNCYMSNYNKVPKTIRAKTLHE